MAKPTAFENRLRSLIPDNLIRLLSSGTLAYRVSGKKQHDNINTYAWTTWDQRDKLFVVNFNETSEDLTDEQLSFLWKHEIGHVVLGHFSPSAQECRQMDNLIATDIGVNWLLRDGKKIINDLGGIDAEEYLTQIELGQRYYPLYIVHQILHEKMAQNGGDGSGSGQEGESGDNFCGGIEQTDDVEALAKGIIVGKSAAEGKDGEAWMRGIGTETGGLGIDISRVLTPPWLRDVERFARSIVEVELADKRSPKRWNPTLKSAGVYVQSRRPTWVEVPAVCCLLVDTSGSMLHDLHYVGPVISYLTQHGITVRLIAGDTQVTMNEEVRHGMPAPSEMKGAGGTDIIPLFDHANEYEPRAVVCFTDGYVPAWPRQPEYPVLWVGLQTEGPGYGEVSK